MTNEIEMNMIENYFAVEKESTTNSPPENFVIVGNFNITCPPPKKDVGKKRWFSNQTKTTLLGRSKQLHFT